jgi:hypothetical protein
MSKQLGDTRPLLWTVSWNPCQRELAQRILKRICYVGNHPALRAQSLKRKNNKVAVVVQRPSLVRSPRAQQPTADPACPPPSNPHADPSAMQSPAAAAPHRLLVRLSGALAALLARTPPREPSLFPRMSCWGG